MSKEDEIFEILLASLRKVVPKRVDSVGMDTQLVDDGILDSLDLMSFLFEFEQKLGRKLEAIGEEFNDFQVRRLVEIASEPR